MLRKKKKQASPKWDVNHHFIFIEVPIDIVAPEVVLWGESEWWPKKCLMRFTRESQGEIGVGTRYRQKIRKPLGHSWKVEVTKFIPDRLVERTFQTGMFQGYEVTKIEERSNGTRIDYELHYKIRGLLNKLLWPLCYRKQHDKNIKMILSALKDHVTKKHQEQQEKDSKET